MATFTIPVNQTTTQSIDLQPFGSISNVRGIDVTATVIQQSDDALVRLIVEDYNGDEYLLLESYRMINDLDTVQFLNYCEETALLSAIEPKTLHIAVKGAKVSVHSLRYATTMIRPHPSLPDMDPNDKTAQALATAAKINQYNENHNLLWRADTTALALKTFSEKMRIMGIHSNMLSTHGMEYYSSGIFVFGSPNDLLQAPIQNNPLFPSVFDWRNRHNKNWLTPIRNQEDSGFCFAFAPVAVLESYIFLYYNRRINSELHLSEDQVASYSQHHSRAHSFNVGGKTDSACIYINNIGVVDYNTFPFENDSMAYENYVLDINDADEWYKPDSLITINAYNDSIRKINLIKKGPLVANYEENQSSFGNNETTRHSMALIGFRQLEVGDKVSISIHQPPTILTETSPYVGKTAWIFKNSWGEHSGTMNDGYMYIVFASPMVEFKNDMYYFAGHLQSTVYDDTQRLVEDYDGDGFYSWGIGPRPFTVPTWAPAQADGDDSDYSKGPMDSYGNPLNISLGNTVILTGNRTWNTERYYYNSFTLLTPNKTLYITAPITLYRGAIINLYRNKLEINGGSLINASIRARQAIVTIKNGGEVKSCFDDCQIFLDSLSTLVIDGGTLEHMSIDAQPGSTIRIIHNGCIKTLDYSDFNLPLGVNLEIQEGKIE